MSRKTTKAEHPCAQKHKNSKEATLSADDQKRSSDMLFSTRSVRLNISTLSCPVSTRAARHVCVCVYFLAVLTSCRRWPNMTAEAVVADEAGRVCGGLVGGSAVVCVLVYLLMSGLEGLGGLL